MAEVLITLAIIGVVAALTLPSLITKINNKGYAERLIKAYSTIQNATNSIIEEEGMPSNWRWVVRGQDSSDAANERIVELYRKNLKVTYFCTGSWRENKCIIEPSKAKSLNNQRAVDMHGATDIYGGSQMLLSDNTLIGLKFTVSTSAVHHGAPSALSFTVDVNGKKKPNVVGRDIFFLYLDEKTGKVLPYTGDDKQMLSNTCNKNSTGQSCAYRIVTEGKMDY